MLVNFDKERRDFRSRDPGRFFKFGCSHNNHSVEIAIINQRIDADGPSQNIMDLVLLRQKV